MADAYSSSDYLNYGNTMQSNNALNLKSTEALQESSPQEQQYVNPEQTVPHEQQQAPQQLAPKTAQQVKSQFAHLKNVKERRLAEFVAKKEKTRHTEGAGGFRRVQNNKVKDLMNSLLQEAEKTEEQTYVEENEVYYITEDSFYAQQDETELMCLKTRQQAEMKKLKHLQEQILASLKKRTAAKKFQREQQRELKNLYQTTHDQEVAYDKMQEIKATLYEHRERCEMVVSQMEERHQKQLHQFSLAEDRRIDDQRVLLELQIRHLDKDKQAEAQKDHASRMHHQKNIDKKKLDQLREQQRLELRQFKDKAEFETRMMEEVANLQNKQTKDGQSMRAQLKNDYVTEKERMIATKTQVKIIELQNENLTEMRRIQAHHKIQLKQLRQAQKIRCEKRMKQWSSIIGRDVSLARKKGSQEGSKDGSQDGSQSSIGSKSGQQSASRTRQSSDMNVVLGGAQKLNLLDNMDNIDEGEDDAILMSVEQQNTAKQQLEDMKKGLVELAKRHDDSLTDLQGRQEQEQSRQQENFQKAMMELEWEHEIEVKDLKKADEAQISEALAYQQKEIAMESKIRDQESRQMQERRILNQILDGVDDAVISMTPRGYLTRFNESASKYWGYKPSEVLGKNIKMLMPQRYSKNHDQYLYNYLSTGIKKVIGTRREVEGLRKDGTEFPIVLTITEVIEEGVHLFNAFIRDLSSEYEAIRSREAEEACLPMMIWKVNTEGDAYFLNQKFIDYTGVEEGNVFDPAVVQPEDARTSWKVFQEANKNKTPFECKRRLKGQNGVYRWFLTRGAPIIDSDGNIQSWCGSCSDVDVTTKLQLEAEALPEVLPQALWKSDPEGNVTFGNSNFLNYIGAKKVDGINVFSATLIHKEDLKKSKATFERAIEKGEAFDIKCRLLGSNGQFKWFVIKGSPIKDEEESVLAVYGTCTDVHEETIQAIEMEALPESLPQLVWKADPEGNVRYANKKFMAFCGATDYSGLNVFSESIVHPDDYKDCLEAFAKCTKEKADFKMNRRLKDKNGEYVKMQTTAVPILDDEKKILGWYGCCNEVQDFHSILKKRPRGNTNAAGNNQPPKSPQPPAK